MISQIDSENVYFNIGSGGQMAILRGCAAVLFGVATLVLPAITLLVLIALFSIYVLIDGVLSLIASFRMALRHDPWLGLLVRGILGVAVGIIGFRAPGLTAISLLYVIAAWSIATGILELVMAFEVRKEIRGEWVMALTGVLSIIFGLLLAAIPGIGLATLVWMVGFYAIVYGGFLIYLGSRLRSIARQ